MWTTIGTIFTTLFNDYPVFTIIAGSFILIFIGGLSIITKVNFSKFKNADYKNMLMKKYLISHLTFKDQITRIDNLSYKIKNKMQSCYQLTYPDSTTCQDNIYNLLLNVLMTKVRDSIISNLKDQEFLQHYNQDVNDRIFQTKEIVDNVLKNNFPKDLDLRKLILTLMSEGQEDIFETLKEMYDISYQIYQDYNKDINIIDDKIIENIQIYS